MSNVLVETLSRTPVDDQRLELVERKGIGHPDSICDAIAEEVSLALCREYLAVVGRVLHHNVDKSLLVAGHTQPRLGGGQVLAPMRLVLGDRATAAYQGHRFNVAEIVEASARDWFRRNLRHVDPQRHLVFQNELKEGSPELMDIFEREILGANDTSAAVYLTVLGTSAEGGDCGATGRGNRVNGLISITCPMSAEAAAGKNPVSHVGKIYSVLSHQLAAQIHTRVAGVREVYVELCNLISFLDAADNVALLPMLAERRNTEARTRATIIVVTHDKKVIPTFKRIFNIRDGRTHQEAGEGRVLA